MFKFLDIFKYIHYFIIMIVALPTIYMVSKFLISYFTNKKATTKPTTRNTKTTKKTKAKSSANALTHQLIQTSSNTAVSSLS
ncbi:hypothetical protein LFWB_1670 [Candidatus Phytoplasma luffae]|uniref:Uncharacterized protein n=1 Tax=Loofah witches'-broom phytoplasma TaxID=35773 RepID=A0A975ILS7_LOWBP|nr:hypothetical protein LFWB_1670 [Candidatus Phytoplasma luffae]